MIDLESAPAGELPHRRAAAEVALLRQMIESATPARPAKTRRRALTGGTIFAVAVAGGAAATAISTLAPRAASVHDGARCYTQVSADAGDDFPGTTVGIASSEQQKVPTDAASAALGLCSALWQRGFLTSQGLQAPAPNGSDGLPAANHTVPPLTACVLDSGQVAIYPARSTVCGDLKLSELASQ